MHCRLACTWATIRAEIKRKVFPSDTVQPTIPPAVLRFSDAVWRVVQMRHDFEGYIWSAFRELIAEHPRRCPFIEQSKVEVILATAGTNPTTDEELLARGSLVGAVLHCWCKVPPDLQTMVFQAARELAVMRGGGPQEILFAEVETHNVTHGGSHRRRGLEQHV